MNALIQTNLPRSSCVKEGTGNIQNHYILKRNWCKINFKDEQVIVDGCLWEWNWVLRVSEDRPIVHCTAFVLFKVSLMYVTFIKNVHFLEM